MSREKTKNHINSNVVLQVSGMQFAYQEQKVVKGISLQVQPEQCYCIFGPNGCGKSTLLNCIIGLHHPDQGEIWIQGKNTKGMTNVQKAREIAYVSQKSDKTFPFTVEQIVLMGRTAYASPFSSPGKADLHLAHEALKSVGMYGFKDRPFTKLSGGETQLVKIARAIAQDTGIIVFDEPTAHLDFRHELNVIKYMVEIIKEKKLAVVMATHFPNHAFFLQSQGINTQVAMMEGGRFQAVGKPDEVLTEENMARIFKVQTRSFFTQDDSQRNQYIVPVDFIEGGSWNHET